MDAETLEGLEELFASHDLQLVDLLGDRVDEVVVVDVDGVEGVGRPADELRNARDVLLSRHRS